MRHRPEETVLHHITATMASSEIGEEFELQDVPYVQYFDKEGYAIHGAYWHDRFGIPKSTVVFIYP